VEKRSPNWWQSIADPRGGWDIEGRQFQFTAPSAGGAIFHQMRSPLEAIF
jgi:hypothetical protein